MNNYESITILLVGTEISSDGDLLEKLRVSGFKIIPATMDTAISLLESVNPDIILYDIPSKTNKMMDMLAVLKNRSIQNHVPLVMIISNENSTDIKAQSFLSGATDYIVRPFGYKELLARILNQVKILNVYRAQIKLYERLKVLEEMAITDELTGLFNRRFIYERLHHEISRAIRYQEPITFIMLDIDFFKRVNDTYGHIAGDQLLKEVAKQIKYSVRDVDIPIRYGGEEFLIACPNTEVSGGNTVAERIRSNIENTEIHLDGRTTKTTVSLGISSKALTPPADAQNELKSLIRFADAALYKAKMNGRNRIEVYNGSLKYADSINNSEVIKQCTQLMDDYKQ